MSIKGYIPEEITIIYSASEKIRSFWWVDFDSENKHIPTEEVTPAFITPSDCKASLETGTYWAERNARVFDPETRSYTHSIPVQTITRPNTPYTGLRIIGLEKRSEGGRAYKVITRDGFYVDLREDVLLDAMKTVGVIPQQQYAELQGQYIWARVGSESKLVRIGSELHAKLAENTQRRNSKNISAAQYTIGGIYILRNGEYFVYLGTCYCPKRYQSTQLKKHHLWYQANNKASFKDIQNALLNALTVDGEFISYRFSITTTKAIIALIGTIEVPDDIIPRFRELTGKHITTYISNYVTNGLNSYLSDRTKRQIQETLESTYKALHIVEPDQPFKGSEIYVKHGGVYHSYM